MMQILRPILCGILLAMLPAASAGFRAVLLGVSDDLNLDADLKGPNTDVRLMVEVLTTRHSGAGNHRPYL